MNINEINNLLNGRRATASKISVRNPKMLAKSRTTKEPTPEQYATIYEVKRETVLLNNDYSKQASNKMHKNGITTKDYDAGTTWYERDGIIGTHKNNGSQYLVYSQNVKTFENVASFKAYDANWNEITDNYKNIKEEYAQASELRSYSSDRQVEQGVSEDNIAIQKVNKLDNVIQLKGSTTLTEKELINNNLHENIHFEFSNPEMLAHIKNL